MSTQTIGSGSTSLSIEFSQLSLEPTTNGHKHEDKPNGIGSKDRISKLHTLSVPSATLTNSDVSKIVKNSRHLQKLELVGCTELTNACGKILDSLHNLRELSVFGCSELGDDFVKGLAGKSNWCRCCTAPKELVSLNLGKTAVTVNGMPHLKPFNKLRAIFFSHSSMNNQCVSQMVENAKQLQDVSFEHCTNLTNACAQSLVSLQNLTCLNMYGCWRIGDEFVEAIVKPVHHTDEFDHLTITKKKLTRLNLGKCAITALSVFYLGDLEHLKALSLARCNTLTQEIDGQKKSLKFDEAAIDHLVKTHPELEELDLDANDDIDDAAIQHLTALPLKTLSLSTNSFSDVGLKAIATISTLTGLSLSWCQEVTNKNLALLQPLQKLTALNLFSCLRVTSNAIEQLRKMIPTLQVVQTSPDLPRTIQLQSLHLQAEREDKEDEQERVRQGKLLQLEKVEQKEDLVKFSL